jgi:uncharacterized protein YggE
VSDRIKVTGKASRDVPPDGVAWHVEALAIDDDPRVAFQRCSARLDELTKTLAGVGAVSTDAVSVRPARDEETGRMTGRVEASGSVQVRGEPARAGELAQAAMSAGADRLRGPRLLYDAAGAVRTELLTDALADARGKADRLAEASGRRIARVRSIIEDESYHGAVELASMSDGPDIRPRSATIEASVRVVFALED